jgi:transposase
LDLSCIYAKYERSDGRGLSAYHPVLMARLLLYGYCIGITSSRGSSRLLTIAWRFDIWPPTNIPTTIP